MPYKYEIGQEVFYTNGYGIPWGNRTIVGREIWGEGTENPKPRYFIAPTDSPWFPVAEDQLSDPHP